MKLLEFLGTIRENAFNEPGKFVGARLTRDSERALMQWMRENGLRKKEPRARLHITVVGDKEQNFDWNPATFEPPLEIDPSSYKIEKFDDGAIVLSFSVPELEKRHEWAIKQYGIQWKYPTYQPHITLSYDPTGLNNTERLLTPTFPMYVANEYAQPWEFNEADSRSNRRRDTRIDEAFLAERNLMNASQAKEWAVSYANAMFGSDPGAVNFPIGVGDVVQKWAATALSRYFINDIPASQIHSFRPQSDASMGRSAPSVGDIRGMAQISTPRVDGYGLMSGHNGERGLVVPAWVPPALERGDEIFWLDERGLQNIQGSLSTVKDWFRHLVNEAPDRLNAGRLSRMTWEQAEQAAFTWHDDMKASTDEGGDELEGDKEIYLDFGKGIAWWKLTGESCLTREGDLMGHCVGDYLDTVQEGDTIIMSLRDAKNQPHATVELSSNYGEWKRGIIDIAQIKGKENKPPVEKYWKYVDKLIKKLDADGTKLDVSGDGHGDLRECGITKIGNMLIRTNPPLDGLDVKFTLIQYPPNREHEWYEFDGEVRKLWEVTSDLMDRYNVIPEMENFDFSQELENPAMQWIKWMLLKNGHWKTTTTTVADNVDYMDDEHLAIDPNDPEPYMDVPTRISISAPDIEYEILAGNPDEYKYDIDHKIASRESNT
jgi:hypothetical protein